MKIREKLVPAFPQSESFAPTVHRLPGQSLKNTSWSQGPWSHVHRGTSAAGATNCTNGPLPQEPRTFTGTRHIWQLPVQMYVDPKDKVHGSAALHSHVPHLRTPHTSAQGAAICVGSPYRYVAPEEEDHQCCLWLLRLGSLMYVAPVYVEADLLLSRQPVNPGTCSVFLSSSVYQLPRNSGTVSGVIERAGDSLHKTPPHALDLKEKWRHSYRKRCHSSVRGDGRSEMRNCRSANFFFFFFFFPANPTGRLLSNFLNFIFHGPPGLSTVDFMIVLE
jgi:hypothetical protein